MSVSIVIPTRNRKEMLRRAIASCYALDLPVEVIVMIDGSTDGTADMVRQEFPAAVVQSSSEALGPCVQRNRGAALATGEFLVTLDDDCEFVSPATLSQTLPLFDRPSIAAVTLPFINVLQNAAIDSAAPGKEGVFLTAFYYGGMIAFRREIYLKLGGYREAFFMNVEEPDLAIRLMDSGYVIRLGTAGAIHHHESAVRDSPGIRRLAPRNHILFTWFNVPFPYLTGQLAWTNLLALRYALRTNFLLLTLKGICSGYGQLLANFSARKPVKRPVYRLWKRMRRRGALRLEEVDVPLVTRRA